MELSQEMLRVMEKQIEAQYELTEKHIKAQAELTKEVSGLRTDITILSTKLSNGVMGSINSGVKENSKKLTALIISVAVLLVPLVTFVVEYMKRGQ